MMGLLRLLGTTLLIIAVAGNPVMAGMMPCFCATPASTVSACCQAHDPDRAEESAAPACCAKDSDSEQQGAQAGVDAPHVGGCCCYESAPATQSPRDVVELPDVVQTLFLGSVATIADPHRAISTSLWPRPDLGDPARPSLMVLYCSWLN